MLTRIVLIMTKILLNTKSESIKILTKYFIKFGAQELKYYLDNGNLPIPNFFNTNVHEPEDVELKYLFLSHLAIVMKKIFNIRTELNYNGGPIKISFVSNSIHWDDLFVISNNIFVSVQYLIKVFELIEYNEYKNTNDVYIEENKIYDIKLLKNISKSIYSILQNLNQEAWNEFIVDKFGCLIIPLTNIIFKNKYTLLREPNVEYMHDKIIVYWLDSEHIYGTFNSICSYEDSFSPYWEQKIIHLSYNHKNNTYTEIDSLNVERYKKKTKSFVNSIIPNPFDYKSIQITNSIIHN